MRPDRYWGDAASVPYPPLEADCSLIPSVVQVGSARVGVGVRAVSDSVLRCWLPFPPVAAKEAILRGG